MHPRLEEVFTHLETSRAALWRAIDEVPAPLREQRPGPERWSTAEVVEHLALVQGSFATRVNAAIAAARAAGLGAEESGPTPLPADKIERMANRALTRSAPEAARPQGRLDHVAAWTAAEAALGRFRETVAGADGLALSAVTIDHPTFGTLNIYQWAELLARHEARHVEQIKEIAATLAAKGQPV